MSSFSTWHLNDFIFSIILCIIAAIIFFAPIFWVYKIFQCILKRKFKIFKREKFILNKTWVEKFYIVIVFLSFTMGAFGANDLTKTGVPLIVYDTSVDVNYYTPLSFNHILTIIIFFLLGVVAYFSIKSSVKKVAPIPYVVCCSLLIINIIFMVVFLLQIKGIKSVDISIEILRYGCICAIPMYIITLKNCMDKVREHESNLNKVYKNKLLNKAYIFFVKYSSKPLLWIVTLFPVLIIIQLILVIFGQQPDSFIKVFLDTSTYNYSTIIPPEPTHVSYNGHYLCTVSLKGHKKIVKPVRAGIRHGNRILVNRQLLIANAFENILEQYTPKFHKFIRYIYDKYGYPLSKHINTSYSADIVYILMKPLEWIFLIVLYCVDKNPENRINIQYSELRKESIMLVKNKKIH